MCPFVRSVHLSAQKRRGRLEPKNSILEDVDLQSSMPVSDWLFAEWAICAQAATNQKQLPIKATTNQTRYTDLCEAISSLYSSKLDPRRFLYQEKTGFKRKKAVYLVNLGKLISKSEIVWFLLQLIYRDKLTGSDNKA